jgi:hypothetical protein
MFKKILFHLAIAAAIFMFANFKDQEMWANSGGGNFHDGWQQLMWAGMGYGLLSTILILLGVNLPYPFDLNASKKARAELLECKKLLDEGILTKEEFDLKSDKLKKMIL